MDFMMDVKLYLCFIIISFVIADDIGSEKTLTCKNVGAPYCLWQKQGYDRNFHDLPKNESKYFRQYTTNMTIKKLTSRDSGTYRCRLFWKSKYTRYSADIRLYVVDKNTNFTLTCKDLQRGATYIWEQIHPLQKTFENHETLILQNIKYRDAGTYRCKYYWPGFPWHYGVNTVIVVQDMTLPQLSIPNNMMFAAIESDVVMTCIVDQTIPQTRHVWWTKLNDERQINISDLNLHRYQGGTLQNPSLKILDVTINDSAEYRCYGGNINGNNYAAMQLITGHPPVVHISKDCYVRRVGDNVTIDVIVKHAPPGSTINWRQGRNYIIFESHRQTIGLINPYLTIRNVELKDAGNYTLFVQNKYGNHSKVTVLKVISATIKGVKGYRKLEKTANDSLTIECEISGGTTVTWRQNGKQLKGFNQLSLQINKISRVNKGNYTCETNLETVTERSSILHLDVKDIPLVTSTSKTFQVNKGDDTILSCSHDSNPTPTHVYWTRNGVNISAYRTTKYNGSNIEFPSLVIHDTSTSDSGTYICSVSNKIGTGYSKPLQLIIKEPEKQTSQAGEIAGILVAIVFVVGVVVIVIILRWRKQKPGTTKRSTAKVSMHRERGDSAIGLHFNSRPMSSVPADEGKVSNKPVVAADAEYYNVSDVTSTCIRVEDLKKYIQKRQRHEELKKEYKSIPNIAEHPTTHAQTKDNMPKNRFKTTFPYDLTRVILKSDGGSDYINANYIDGFEKERCYIASQGPVKNTVADHWKMIWQENIHKIVMVTNLVEGIKTKCEQYWPCGGKQMVHGNLIIRLNAEKERTAYVTREISIEDKKSGKTRNVTQYHFTAWPDHGTPDPLYLVLFHRHVISDPKAGHSGPLLVHCSAGIGRTGTYIALDALLEEGRTTGFLDILKFLKKMRYSRMNMIQTSNQYVCLHYALLEAFTMKETKIRKDEFSEVWQSIRTDHKALNHQRLNKEFKELEQHVGETKGLSPSMLNATKDDQNHNQYNAAMSTTNLAKNRNKDVLPMDDKRVYLVSYGKGRSDYINAVQVPSYTKFVGYITTQLPLPDTKVDFWTMIRDHSSSTIVLIINKANEADLVYSQSGDDLTIGPFGIKISARKKGENDITKITMVLSRKDDKPRQVVLFQAICNSIPDPAVVGKLADLISTRANMSNDPITVVSSDGAKNCGLFCAFTNAVSSMQIDNHADIFQLVRLLQLRRPEFFTDFEEYKRCYEALNLHLESANVYANF